MLRFRSFRNTDPPLVTAIWRSLAGRPGIGTPVSVDLFEQCVFAKLYFDYPGLIFAFEDDRVVGFVHAGFGPNAQQTGVCTETGVIPILLVCPDCARGEVATGLLEQAEQYLRRRGTTAICGGGLRPFNPFYTGLYGGGELPGILDSDDFAHQALTSRGFEPVQQVFVFRQDLANFHPPVDRQQVQFRRRMLVQVLVDPPSHNWWEAATLGDFDLTRFELVPRGGGAALARAVTRDMMLTDGSLQGRAASVLELEVDPAHRRQGMATYLLAESFRLLAGQGYEFIETAATADNTVGVQLLRKVGFRQTAEGTVFRKELRGS